MAESPGMGTKHLDPGSTQPLKIWKEFNLAYSILPWLKA
jgi:hypothetical protein